MTLSNTIGIIFTGDEMESTLLNTLKAETTIEKQQKISDVFIEDIPSYARAHKDKNFTLSNSFFFTTKDVYISKHNRYADYPEHTHSFLEMNYMVSGECTQIVNGKEIHLTKNDLLLLDIGCSHSIKKLGKNDILINILFQNKNISIDWLNNLKKSRSLLYTFIFNTIYGKENSQKYLIFKNNSRTQINSIIDSLITEYYEKKPFYNEMISAYLKILLTELVRNYRLKNDKKLSDSQKYVTKVLHDIEKDYATLTLAEEAKKVGYNKNYLSNLLKKETGKSFKELLTYERILNAHLLLTSTSDSVFEIMEKVGITNKTFFYKKYQSQYNQLPSTTRSNSQKDFINDNISQVILK